MVDDLHPTEDGEASEEAHCASYQAKLCLHCHLQIITKICIVIKICSCALALSHNWFKIRCMCSKFGNQMAQLALFIHFNTYQ